MASLLDGLDRDRLEARFWPKVARRSKGECWNWTGAPFGEGYGGFTLGVRRNVGAHRVAYELAYGPVADGLWVLHTCDNRKCCNPRHLFAGTHFDNMRDMAGKDRANNGYTAKPEWRPKPAPTHLPKKMPPAGTPYWCWLMARAEDRGERPD